MSGRTQFAGPRVPSLPERIRLKVIGLGVRGYFAFKRLRYRLRRRPGGKLHPDHITIPCGDLRVAEESIRPPWLRVPPQNLPRHTP